MNDLEKLVEVVKRGFDPNEPRGPGGMWIRVGDVFETKDQPGPNGLVSRYEVLKDEGFGHHKARVTTGQYVNVSGKKKFKVLRRTTAIHRTEKLAEYKSQAIK